MLLALSDAYTVPDATIRLAYLQKSHVFIYVRLVGRRHAVPRALVHFPAKYQKHMRGDSPYRKFFIEIKESR